jgi:hypothetical protein
MSISKGSNDTILDALRESIDSAVKQSINQAFDDAIKEAVREANDRRDEVIASTSLKLSQWVNFQYNETVLKITVEKPKEIK